MLASDLVNSALIRNGTFLSIKIDTPPPRLCMQLMTMLPYSRILVVPQIHLFVDCSDWIVQMFSEREAIDKQSHNLLIY